MYETNVPVVVECDRIRLPLETDLQTTKATEDRKTRHHFLCPDCL